MSRGTQGHPSEGRSSTTAGRLEGQVVFLTGAGWAHRTWCGPAAARWCWSARRPASRCSRSWPHYTTSKWAVRGMAKAFAVELSRHGVRVNSLHPGGVATSMGTGDMQAALGAAMATDQRLGAMFMPLLPIETALPEDLSNAVLFLLSEESRTMTGKELVVDAGTTEL